jgi:hypothetical protein
VLRLGDCLELPRRECNALLVAAGFAAAFPERGLEDPVMEPYRTAMRAILEGHAPFPASAVAASGRVLLANDAFARLFPDAETLSAEAAIDRFYGQTGPARIANWPELAWAEVDRRRREAARFARPELHALADRAQAHLRDVPRPAPGIRPDAPPAGGARWKHGDRIRATFTTVRRVATALDVTRSETRVELILPADEATAAGFRKAGA